MNTQVQTPSHPQDWVHPQLKLRFSRTLHLILPRNIINNNQLYITITLSRFHVSYSISPTVLPYLSYHWNHPYNPQFPLQVPYQRAFIPPILCRTQYWIQEKLPHMTQVLHYLHKYTLLSISSALACLIGRTFPYAFIHQSWWKHMHPFTPLRNDSNPISTFNNPLHSSLTHPSIPIKITQVKYLLFSFQIIILLSHVNKGPRLFLFYTYLH